MRGEALGADESARALREDVGGLDDVVLDASWECDDLAHPPDAVAPGNRETIVGGTPAEATQERVPCAIGDGAYRDDCTIERTAARDGTLLTIRHRCRQETHQPIQTGRYVGERLLVIKTEAFEVLEQIEHHLPCFT